MARLSVDVAVPLRHFELRVALEVAEGETLALVGPSGAGKTTVLRAIAGATRPGSGRIALGERVLFDRERRINLPPEARRVGYVFQEYALFPHMSVRENVAFGGKVRADELLERFGIAHLAKVRPAQLSGGERQRVGLARALASDPAILLFDEPLSALDTHTRAGVRGELQGLLAELALPAVLVTHDFEDAAALADRVGVIVRGGIRQLGTAHDLVAAPSDAFVASFVGSNLLVGVARPAGDGLAEVTLEHGGAIYAVSGLEGPVGAVIHPWEVSIATTAPTGDESTLNRIHAPVGSLVPVGGRVRVRVGPVVAEVTTGSAERLGLERGTVVTASFKATATRLVPLGAGYGREPAPAG